MPFTKPLSFEAKKATALVISSGIPTPSKKIVLAIHESLHLLITHSILYHFQKASLVCD
jgi:hypothetical protein